MISGDTIVAPATPFGYAGLAVIRISGPETDHILKLLSRRKTLPASKKASLMTLYDKDDARFEDAVVTRFKAPFSYTGENVVEISLHGNPLLVQKVINLSCEYGARLADPGEFTQRSFINSKMDLIQVESVASFINARSDAALRLNYRLLRGDLSVKFNSIKKLLIDIIGRIEWWLDISEDEKDPELMPFLSGSLESLLKIIRSLLDSYSTGRKINEGYFVVIAGLPNVGKSTLLNALANTDRAITSHIPGTTRDSIDFSFSIDGMPITLVDTAGLRDTSDIIESKGIERTLDHIKRADLILNIRTADTPPVDINSLSQVSVINIFNKSDVVAAQRLSVYKKSDPELLYISALKGAGIGILRDAIKRELGISGALGDDVNITTARQHRSLTDCMAALLKTEKLLNDNPPSLELVSVELLDALGAIDTILGKTTPDDILNNIFGSFCVGK